MFVIFCAEQVAGNLDGPMKKPALEAIEITKLWLEGKATEEDCKVIAYTTYRMSRPHNSMVSCAAKSAAYAADVPFRIIADNSSTDHSAWSCAVASRESARHSRADHNKTLKDQVQYLDLLLNWDKYAEELLI